MDSGLMENIISLAIIVIVALLLIIELQFAAVERIPVLSWWKRRK